VEGGGWRRSGKVVEGDVRREGGSRGWNNQFGCVNEDLGRREGGKIRGTLRDGNKLLGEKASTLEKKGVSKTRRRVSLSTDGSASAVEGGERLWPHVWGGSKRSIRQATEGEEKVLMDRVALQSEKI